MIVFGNWVSVKLKGLNRSSRRMDSLGVPVGQRSCEECNQTQTSFLGRETSGGRMGQTLLLRDYFCSSQWVSEDANRPGDVQKDILLKEETLEKPLPEMWDYLPQNLTFNSPVDVVKEKSSSYVNIVLMKLLYCHFLLKVRNCQRKLVNLVTKSWSRKLEITSLFKSL